MRGVSLSFQVESIHLTFENLRRRSWKPNNLPAQVRNDRNDICLSVCLLVHCLNDFVILCGTFTPTKVLIAVHFDVVFVTHLNPNDANIYVYILRKPAGRLGVVSPCERSENKEGVWGRGVVDTGAFFGRNRRCLGWRFWVSGSRLYH